MVQAGMLACMLFESRTNDRMESGGWRNEQSVPASKQVLARLFSSVLRVYSFCSPAATQLRITRPNAKCLFPCKATRGPTFCTQICRCAGLAKLVSIGMLRLLVRVRVSKSMLPSSDSWPRSLTVCLPACLRACQCSL